MSCPGSTTMPPGLTLPQKRCALMVSASYAHTSEGSTSKTGTESVLVRPTRKRHCSPLPYRSGNFGLWRQLALCPSGCERLHPAFLALDAKIFVAAGSGPASNLRSAWSYDIASNAWEQLADLPGARTPDYSSRDHPYQFALGNPLQPYVFGGHGNYAISKDLYRWEMQGSTWSDSQSASGSAERQNERHNEPGNIRGPTSSEETEGQVCFLI